MLTEDPAPALNELQRLDALLDEHGEGTDHTLFVSLDEVSDIDAPALLYMCSRFQALHGRFPEIRGTWPRAFRPRLLMFEAGFEEWIGGRTQPRGGTKVVTICSSREYPEQQQVHPEIAGRVSRFLKERHTLSHAEHDHLGFAVNEALENVAFHAYEGEESLGWHVVGVFDRRSGRATVAIADVGVGIASTLKRRLSEQIPIFGPRPVDFLQLACTGTRTASGEAKRGKGLRTLREFAQEAPNRRFHVISSGAMVTWSDSPTPGKYELCDNMRGTVVCLEVWEGS